MKVCTIFCTYEFLWNPSQSPQLLVYVVQLANLYVAQSTSTSHKSNSGMYCYIDGEAYESVIGTKFGTSYYDVLHVYNVNNTLLCFTTIGCFFLLMFINVPWSWYVFLNVVLLTINVFCKGIYFFSIIFVQISFISI